MIKLELTSTNHMLPYTEPDINMPLRPSSPTARAAWDHGIRLLMAMLGFCGAVYLIARHYGPPTYHLPNSPPGSGPLITATPETSASMAGGLNFTRRDVVQAPLHAPSAAQPYAPPSQHTPAGSHHGPDSPLAAAAPEADGAREEGLNFTRREILSLDVQMPPYYPFFDPTSIRESLQACSYSWNVSGTLKLVRGDPEQRPNFMIGVSAAASSQMALDSVSWHTDGRRVELRCVEFPSATDYDMAMWDAAVQVDATVFVKPHTVQFGAFNANLQGPDIEIAAGLEFESYRMSLFTGAGGIHGAETNSFTAHDISVATVNGSITGTWSLPSSISLRTGGWQSIGSSPIDINIVPKRWSHGPTTAGSLSASSSTGDITIRMPFARDTLSLRNTSIAIHSEAGSIEGTFVTGGETSLTTGAYGSINATLLPNFGLRDTVHITTSTAAGETEIRVLPPIVDGYYKINPLNNTRSDHSSKGGDIRLHYPPEWRGTALGLSKAGNVSISGPDFSTIVVRDHLVVARKGEGIESRLDFTTESGDGELLVA